MGAGALVFILIHPEGRGTDAYSYWSFDPQAPYVAAMGNLDASVAFRYAPPVALILEPFRALPWPAFLWLYTCVLLGALAWLCRSWTLAAIALYPILLELSVANVHILMAAALVRGLRRPAAWSFLVLTKVTPGICLLWFAVRREWRALATAVLATAAIAAVSWLLAPDLWRQWISMLVSDAGVSVPADRSLAIPLLIRLPLAALIVAWGARTDRPWVLAVATFLALPTIWPSSLAVLVAVPALLRWPAPSPAASAPAPTLDATA